MPWTDQEIQAYRPRPYDPLLRLYEHYKLSATDPEARARFLAEDVLRMTATDHDALTRLAQAEGNVFTLHHLEDTVINSHRSFVHKYASTLSVPLPH